MPGISERAGSIADMAPAIRFTVKTRPTPAPRPRFGKGRAYMPKAVREYRAIIRQAWDENRSDPVPEGQPFRLRVRFFYETPARTANSYPRAADLDNLVKEVADALQGEGGPFLDDALMVRLVAEKAWGKHDAIEISIDW